MGLTVDERRYVVPSLESPKDVEARRTLCASFRRLDEDPPEGLKGGEQDVACIERRDDHSRFNVVLTPARVVHDAIVVCVLLRIDRVRIQEKFVEPIGGIFARSTRNRIQSRPRCIIEP